MGMMKVLWSLFLCLLILAAVPAVRAEAAQCPVSLLVISTTDRAPAGDQCHVQSMPSTRPLAPRVIAGGNSSVGPAVFRTWVHAPHDLQGAIACRLNAAP